MEQDISLDIEAIKHRSIHGLAALIIRTFFIQAFTFFATFILTIILAPSVFGLFFVVSAILNFFVYFSDIGLAAALIQKKEAVTKADLSSTFTIQQIIVVSLVSVGLALSGTIGQFYKLDASGLLLLRVLIFSLFLSSLKTIPSIILERKLSFAKLVIPQIAETIVFYSAAIILAIKGFGISSFTYAVLLRGVVGIVVVYIVSPWRPSFMFDKTVARKLVSFGVPFQLNSVLALLKDDLLIIVLGRVLPLAQLGYIGWGQKWAFTPLRFFMDNVIKVTFPSYSRLQESRDHLAKAINKSLFFVTFTVYPSVVGMMVLAPRIIDLIPKYQKWEPAIPLLYLFGINALFAAVNTTLTNIIFALGKPKIVLKLMVVWTILTWILTYFLLLKFGYLGVAMASALVAASTSIIIYYVKKEVNVSIVHSIKVPLIASIVMFAGIKFVSVYLPNNVLTLFGLVILGVVIYLSVCLIFMKDQLFKDMKTLSGSLLKRN